MRVRTPSPFHDQPDEERAKLERAFLECWAMVVEAESDAEEAWAYEKLREMWGSANDGEIVGTFFDAMKWAAWERGRLQHEVLVAA